MRILHLVSRLGVGGIERYLLTLVRGLDGHEFRSDVACVGRRSSDEDSLVGAFRSAGAGVWHLPVPMGALGRLREFRRRVLIARYDVVHSHLGDASGPFAAALHGTGVRFIASYHHANFHPTIPLSKRLVLGASRQWLRASRVPLSGCSDHAILSHFHGRPSGFWRSAYYGLDTDRFCPATSEQRLRTRELLGIAADRTVITHIGRFVPEKNHRIILDTAETLRARLPGAVFILVGSGPLREWVAREVQGRGLDQIVSLAGETDNPEIYLRASDVFFLPSQSEGLGLALLEAHASGLPVVASDLPALREFAAEWPGVRLAAPDAEALARELFTTVSNLEASRRRTLETLPELRRRFSMEAAVTRWTELIRAVWESNEQGRRM